MLKTLESTGSEREIGMRYDAPLLEFEVHAYLYSALRAKGVKVRGEVPWIDTKTREYCRFDLVIYDDELKPAQILEIKARPVRHQTAVEDTRQCKRYRCFGIPTTFVYGMEGADTFLRSVGEVRA